MKGIRTTPVHFMTFISIARGNGLPAYYEDNETKKI